MLPRRLPPGCRLCWYFRAPERPRSTCLNHLVARVSGISVLPRRLPPGSRLRLSFRAPERSNSRSWNHCSRLWCCDFSALQTSPSSRRERVSSWHQTSAPEIGPSTTYTHVGFFGRVIQLLGGGVRGGGSGSPPGTIKQSKLSKTIILS